MSPTLAPPTHDFSAGAPGFRACKGGVIQWLFSFLSADKRKTYCLYEAPNPEAIRAAARRLGLPADTIVEVGSELGPLAAAMTPLREQVGAPAQAPA
jgi:hypothetical protein